MVERFDDSQKDPRLEKNQFKQERNSGRRPGTPVSEAMLWQLRVGPDKKEKGVVDPEGNFVPLNRGERFVINKGEGTDYEAVALGQGGERRVLKQMTAEIKAQTAEKEKAALAKVRQELGIPEKLESKDAVYAEKYWEGFIARGKKPELIEKLKQVAREVILNAAQSEEKIVGVFLGKEGLDEDTKGHISAYRVIAQEMGYEIGQFKVNKSSGTATGMIRKL